MADHAPFLPGLSPVAGKPVQVAFDGGRLTSDAGVLLLAEIEQRLGIAERLARCIAVVLGHLTEAQRRAYRIADNRLAESPWDEALLSAELQDLLSEDFD